MQPEEQLMVKPINKEKLEKYLTKTFPVKKNQRCRTELSALVCENVMTDNECCYWYLEKKFHDGKIQFVYTAPVGLVTKTKTGESFSLTPSFYHDMSLDELKPYIQKEVSLKEFMTGRFNYNPRITSNQRNFMKNVGFEILKTK